MPAPCMLCAWHTGPCDMLEPDTHRPLPAPHSPWPGLSGRPGCSSAAATNHACVWEQDSYSCTHPAPPQSAGCTVQWLTGWGLGRYAALLACIQQMDMDELVMAIRRRSQGFTRGTSSYRGVTQHKSGGDSGIFPSLPRPTPHPGMCAHSTEGCHCGLLRALSCAVQPRVQHCSASCAVALWQAWHLCTAHKLSAQMVTPPSLPGMALPAVVIPLPYRAHSACSCCIGHAQEPSICQLNTSMLPGS